MSKRDFVPMKEVTARTGFSVPWVHRQIEDGVIPAYVFKEGRRVVRRIPRDGFEEFLKNSRNDSPYWEAS